MHFISTTMLLLLTALLVGCNDDGNTDTSPEPTVDKKGWAEQELYHPVNHPDGTLLSAGHTGILFLEAPTTAPVSAQGDTSTVGEDEIWINLIHGGALTL